MIIRWRPKGMVRDVRVEAEGEPEDLARLLRELVECERRLLEPDRRAMLAEAQGRTTPSKPRKSRAGVDVYG